MRRPILFPFAAYVALVPFDNLLSISSFGTLTKLLAIVSAMAMLLWMLRHKTMVAPLGAWKIWALLLLWMAASSMWAFDANTALTTLLSYVTLFLLFMVVAIFPISREDFRLVLIATIGGALAAALYGAYLFHGNQDVEYSRLFLKSGNFLIDPNHFAAALLLPLALALVEALRTPRLLPKVALLATCAAFIAGILVSGSRGSLVALAFIFGYIFLRSRYRIQLAVIAVIAVLGSFAFDPTVWLRFGNAADTGGAGRVSIWLVGVEAFKHLWLSGAGLGNFQIAYDQYFLHVFQSYFADWHRESHNLIIGTSVELGVVGIALMLAWWFGMFRSLRTIAPGDQFYDLRVALEGAILGLFVAAMFVDVMPYKYPWLAFGLVALAHNVIRLRMLGAVTPSSSGTEHAAVAKAS